MYDQPRPVEASVPAASAAARSLDVVAEAVAFLRENLEDDTLSLGQLAARAGQSQFRLIRLFKAFTGVTPAKFLFALRMERAKRLLLETDRTVTDICFDVGYNGFGTFVTRFTVAVGVSPTKFRSFRDAAPDGLLPLIDRLVGGSAAGPAEGLECKVSAPASFSGLVFVGCFASCIPEARPESCAITHGSSKFMIPQAGCSSKRRYFALGVPWHNLERSMLRGDAYLRAAASAQDGQLCLPIRPAERLDPPVVVFLPALLNDSRRPDVNRPAVAAFH